MKPLLKWAGGKTKLLPELLKHVPARIGCYVEPFVGGGALFFELASRDVFKSAVLTDKNAELINFYAQVQRNPHGLIEVAGKLAKEYSEAHFYEVRDLFNLRRGVSTKRIDIEKAAMFLYLNKTCFNGLWRVNRKGLFNVPWGKYASPTIVDADAIFQASALLKKVVLAVSDFEGAVMGGGDFIYCDPPYDVVSETADFTGYTAGGFGWSEQERLERWARKLDARVVMSNADTPRIRKLYDKGWKLHGVKAARAINSKGDKRGKVGELIMVKR